jgi:hypothetical protein
MNLGQTMLTLGMFVLLMMTVISANRMLMENSAVELETEALATSSTIANDLFAEIMAKPFDQRVVMDTTATPWRQDTTGTKVSAESGLSAYNGAQWGVRNLLTLPDTSSSGNYLSKTRLKDIDDYDGYKRIVHYGNIRNDTVSVKVYYVVYTAPDVLTSSQQYFKKVEVTVSQAQYLLNQAYSAMAAY